MERVPAERRRALAGRLDESITTYREQWSRRSRPGGLEDSCDKLRRTVETLSAGT